MMIWITWYQFLGAIGGMAGVFLVMEYVNEVLYMRKNKVRPHNFGSFPLGLPMLVGFLKAHYDSELNRFCRKRFDEFGVRTVRVQALTRRITVTIDPENIKAILATQFKDFDLGLRYEQFQPLMGDGVFTLSGDGWFHSRALLRPHFATEEANRLQIIEKHCQSLFDVFLEKSANGATFDLQDVFFKLTLDTATEMLFGESTECLSMKVQHHGDEYPSAEEFADAFNTAQKWLLYRTMALRLYFLINLPSYTKASKTCHKFISYYVDRALKYREKQQEEYDEFGRKKYYFLKELANETQDPVLMRDQAMNILLAGRDTTAGTLSFTFAMLLRNKHVFYKLRNEVLNTFGTDTENISFHTLKRCDYLRHVLNEVLRLYPQVPHNFRTATRDTTLPRGGGPDESEPIFIQKGSAVFYDTYSLQRDKEFWGEDADKFIPERWDETQKNHLWKYIPFNGGPRICLGQQFALTEIGYVVVRILQTFNDIKTTQDFVANPIKEHNTLTLSVSGGVPISFIQA
jgi:cytochrome P450